MAEEDDYRSSDDEDYKPEENLDDDDEDEKEENDDSDNGVEDKVEAEKNGENGADVPSSSSDDVDALFAELTEQDPILSEFNRRKAEAAKKAENDLSTSGISESSSCSTEKQDEFEELIKSSTNAEEVQSEKPETVSASAQVKTTKKRAGGLEAIQAKYKKTKISVLEKSDHDWNTFKTEHNINEDLSSHNRGKGGYLNKLEFLNRTDNRQFESERQFRANARKDAF